MSLRILKAGILDSFQDMGRYGFQSFGINPTGSMDRYSAGIANMLVGNDPEDALIEMHFPASVFLFDQPAVIALSGADLNASINGEFIPINQPLAINKSSVLQFHNIKSGARCYMAIRGGFVLNSWLNSYSTNLKAEAGGFEGRKLKKDDTIELKNKIEFSKILGNNDFKILPWKANGTWNENKKDEILVLRGNEWDWLNADSQKKFLSGSFSISNNSDRMGYRLTGAVLQKMTNEELISSAVCFGTIQLLPDGQIIILMADHQTSGGFPRIGNIITADLPKLAQMKAGDSIHFAFTDQKTAEELLIKQQQYLLQLQNACTFRIENFLHENN